MTLVQNKSIQHRPSISTWILGWIHSFQIHPVWWLGTNRCNFIQWEVFRWNHEITIRCRITRYTRYTMDTKCVHLDAVSGFSSIPNRVPGHQDWWWPHQVVQGQLARPFPSRHPGQIGVQRTISQILWCTKYHDIYVECIVLCNTMYGAKYVRPPPLYEGCLKGELQGGLQGDFRRAWKVPFRRVS